MKSLSIYRWSQLLLVFYLTAQTTLCSASPAPSVNVSTPTNTELNQGGSELPSHNDIQQPTAPSPQLEKPPVLAPISATHEELPSALDTLIVNQYTPVAPYVPLVQSIQLAIEYDKLAWNLWKAYRQKHDYKYTTSLHVLLRKNIQIFGRLGRDHLYPTLVTIKKNKQPEYNVKGTYGSGGIRYVIQHNPQSNFYIGMGYAGSYFKHSASDCNQTATWWAVHWGAEQELLPPWIYAGFIIHVKGLSNFKKANETKNYAIPGYGRNVNRIVPAINFYIKFHLSFLEKQLSFGTPRQR